MSRYLQRPRRRITVYLGILMVAGLAWTARAQQQPAPPANQASNFTGGEVTTLNELVALIAHEAGVPPPKVRLPVWPWLTRRGTIRPRPARCTW